MREMCTRRRPFPWKRRRRSAKTTRKAWKTALFSQISRKTPRFPRRRAVWRIWSPYKRGFLWKIARNAWKTRLWSGISWSFCDFNGVLREMERKSLEECTFVPNLPGKTGKNQGKCEKSAHLVNGLERFYELNDLKHKKLNEKKEREEKAFEIAKKYDKNKHFLATKPQPFKLSSKNC